MSINISKTSKNFLFVLSFGGKILIQIELEARHNENFIEI